MATLLIFIEGCGFEGKQIFVEEGAEYELTPLNDSELVNDKYYIKNGSKFYEAYMPNGTVSSMASQVDSKRLFWLDVDESLIPTYYKGELIAYPSENLSLDRISVERFSDVGYSIGLYGGTVDDEGYLCYKLKENSIGVSNAYSVLSQSKSDQIRITTINDNPVNTDSINSGGIITGLSQNEEYTIGYYAGTYYSTATVKADEHYLQSYEIINIDKAETTKNGYLSISLPDDAKSGYYLINGYGLFKYYDYKKGEQDDSKTDMNEPYYRSYEEQIMANSQKYVVNVPTKANNISFTVSYNAATIDEESIQCILQAPSGEIYTMQVKEPGTIFLQLAEAVAGRWSISISPKEMEIIDVTVDAETPSNTTVTDSYDFVITEDSTNIQFIAEYTGDGDIWGVVKNENGETVSLENLKDNRLSAVYSYLSAGTYTVTIYHYADTAIDNVTYQTYEDNLENEIITIEE